MRLKSGVIMKGQILQPYTQKSTKHAYRFSVSSYIHVINFEEASGRFFFHFLEVFEKCIEYIRIFFIHFREISKFGKAGRE